MKYVLAALVILCSSSFSNAEMIEVQQDKLSEMMGCHHESELKLSCFNRSVYLTDYDLYMIELKLDIHDQNLKGMSVEEYIDNTLDGLIGFFSPIGAKFFTGKTDYPLESVIASPKFNAESLVLTTKSYYKDRVFTSYIRAIDSEPVYLRKETVEGDIEPFTLIISGCEKAKTIPDVSNSVLERICKFGGAFDSGL